MTNGDGLGLRRGALRLEGVLPTRTIWRDPEPQAQRAFRDRLRADPALRDAYAAAKQALIGAGIARKDYADAKTPFILAASAGR